MTDVREKARELTRTTYDLASFEVASNEIESALREARNAALEEAAGVADGQAEYLASLTKTDLYLGRIDSVNAVAKLIRALKDN